MNYKLLSLSLFFIISGNQTIRSMESDETEQCAKHIETEDKKQDLFPSAVNNPLFARCSEIKKLIGAFYSQPFDAKDPITKEQVIQSYKAFIQSLSKEELGRVKIWNEQNLMPQPKWLTEK